MAKVESKDIGIVLVGPKQKCSDVKCPFHGNLSLRGRQFTGVVISTKMRRTAVIEFNRLHFLKKYERYEKRRTKLKIHNPECINAKGGDIVRVMECRPLSKTKNFVIIEKLGIERGFKGKMEVRESGKVMTREKDEVKVKEEE